MPALIELRDITRIYTSGEQQVVVLDKVNLSINSGEMVAIMGASGSGKSTLMNILGCLDKATQGDYLLQGKNVEHFDDAELAALRREHFGFIFQRYHLLPHLNALQNVEIPAIYASESKKNRKQRAKELLTQLGLSNRLDYYPSQLSGGQQQRVSIARALMNGGQVILADEPTGALDSQSRQEVMGILKELHKLGHTIIVVTHDRSIAEQTERIIEIADGKIIGESRTNQDNSNKITLPSFTTKSNQIGQMWSRFSEALIMAWYAMFSSKMRTLLTMLGIIIGITSVVSVIVIGNAAKEMVLSDIQAIGTNTLDIYPGKDTGSYDSLDMRALTQRDVLALQSQDYIKAVSPSISTSIDLKSNEVNARGEVIGVGPQYFNTYEISMLQGVALSANEVKNNAQVVVISETTKARLFPNQTNVLGEVLLIGNMPATVIGVAKNKQYILGDYNQLQVLVPYTAVFSRLSNAYWFNKITVRVKEGYSSEYVTQRIEKFLTLLHGKTDFNIFNLNSIVKTIEKTAQTLQLFLILIAVISLVVGGVGVMNIMLVSVSERTREIGIRMAVGARASDVLQQFLIESIFVCLVGGAIGSVFAYLIAILIQVFLPQWHFAFSFMALFGAFICSSGVGLLFGYIPARNASRLRPIDALSRE